MSDVAPRISLEERFCGCLLGQAVGDGLGAPYEGLSAENLYWGYGRTGEIIKNPTNKTLYYTDDTQMMIGVAETLADHGQILEESLCQAFVTNYHPDRCYGQGARRVLEAMAAGRDWRKLTRDQFPGGSFGNGAAMRVAPVGLLFHEYLDQVMEQARLSALPTHTHPLGIEGAQLLGVAVALMARERRFEKKAFYRELSRRAKNEEYKWLLSVASKFSPGDPISILGNSLEAHRSVVTAIACFTSSPESYEHTIDRAIGLGNDTDTLAAMAGAISGAHLGVSAIPIHLLDKLEDNSKGRSYIKQLAGRLFDRHQSQKRD